MHLLKRRSFFGSLLVVVSVLVPFFGTTTSAAFAATNITPKIAAPAAPLPHASFFGCTNPTAVYALSSAGQLVWYGYADPAGGSSSWVNNGIGNVVGSGWGGFSRVFSGGNGVIYAIKTDGTLWWYNHLGYFSGSSSWANSGIGKHIGQGWFFSSVFSVGGGIIYAVKTDGTLLWYNHLGFDDGSSSWANGGIGKVVGNGWSGFSRVFSGGNGIIYAVKPDGTLLWYDHFGYLDGSSDWDNGGIGQVIGSGWSGFSQVFSAGGGIIFAIRADGTLSWYRHLGFEDGSATWANGGVGQRIGSGWNSVSRPFTNVWSCG